MQHTTILKRFTEQQQAELELMALADDMASKAGDMRGQNYELFLQTRQQFKEKLHTTLMASIREQLPFSY
jgi:hypothetical protein